MSASVPPVKKPAPSKVPGFNEVRFDETFYALVGDGQREAALTHLIDALPSLSASRMNRKEKLKHLSFAGRVLQGQGLGKYGRIKLKAKAAKLLEAVGDFGLQHRGCFVDLGCGAHEPLAMATLMYANGFDAAFGNDFLPVRNPAYAALSMYDILCHMHMFPEEYLMQGADPDLFAKRIKEFDIAALCAGDWEKGLGHMAGKVEFKSCDIVDAGFGPDSVSFLISFAVFEHVMDVPGVTKHLFEIMEPGGLGFHFIDLADHRAYRHDGEFNHFSFLTDEDGPANINRLRASEQIAAFEAAGFEILDTNTTQMDVPAATRAAYLPRFAAMSEADQTTYAMRLVIRKP